MNFTHKDINKKALYVLREDSNGKFHTEYLPIQINDSLSNSIKNLQDNMQEKTKDKSLSKDDIYRIKTQMILNYWQDIQNNHSYLFGYRYYCYNITGSYVSSPGISMDFKMEFMPSSPDDEDVRIKKSENDFTRIQYIFSDEFFESYFIEEKYKECKRDHNIKAYSHRRIGWQLQNFDLNNIFSIEIITNFGYGCANAFYVTLIFKGIKIIPYSRLVLYHHYYRSNCIDLLRNTWDFYISDGSWELAFDMIRDACNNYQQKGENNFIKKYFIDELETLTSKLSEYLDVQTFELSEYGHCINRNEEMIKIQLESFPLIIFRGEKVAVAVNFVESIKEVDKILPTQKYVDIIIDCCRTVLLQFDTALNELNSKIEKTICSEISSELNTYKSYLSQISEYKKNIAMFIEKETND